MLNETVFSETVFQVYEPYISLYYNFLMAIPVLILFWFMYKTISKVGRDISTQDVYDREPPAASIERIEQNRYEQEQAALTREHEMRMAIAAEQVQEYRRQTLGRNTTHENTISPQVQEKQSQPKEQKTKHDPSERFENIIE